MNESENLVIRQRMIDTNVILRFLIGDGGDYAAQAKRIFSNAADGQVEIVISDIVFIECVHVLKSYYKHTKQDIANALRAVMRLPGVRTTTPPHVLIRALDNFETVHVPWPDAFIAALAEEAGMEIYSFDAHFDQLPVRKLTPGSVD